MSERWTQDQRDDACKVFMRLAGNPKDAVELSATAWDASIELACQRNELLEALKTLIDVCDGNYRELTDEMRLLCAKAEGK